MRRASRGHQLYLDLKHFLFPGFVLFLLSAPLLRGLFFQADLLPHQMIMGAILAFAAFEILLTRDEEVLRGPLAWGFLLLAASYGLSTFGAVTKAEAVRGFLKYLMYFGVFVVSAYLSRSTRGRRALMFAVFCGATAVAVIGMSSATGLFAFPGASQGGRIMSTLQYPNALAAYLMFSSLIGLTLSSTEENLLLRSILSLATFLQTLVFLASYSRGGWVIYPFALVTLYIGIPREYKGRAVFDICAALTSVLLVVRGFAESIASTSPAKGIGYAGAGLVIVLVFYVVQWVFRTALRDRIGPQAGTALTWAAGVYAFATFALYMFLMASQHNIGIAGVVPASILNRLSSISMDDPSLLTRAFSTRDAFSIFLDHPLIGGGAGAWNALYHQYQRVLYWTTEVHNHFAQVLVETGVLGFLSYIFVWGSATFYALKHCFRAKGSELELGPSKSRANAWGLLTAALAIGVHSAMDFELSLPGLAVQVWAVLGILSGEVRSGEDRDSVVGDGDNEAGIHAKSQRRQGLRIRTVATAVLLLAAAAGLLVPSYLYQRAAWYGNLGARALIRQDFYNAVGLYNEAKKLDPLTADYSVDIAQAHAAMYAFDPRIDLKDRSLSELENANHLEPFNIVHRTKEVEILISLNETGRALEVSRELTRLVPMDVRTYEIFARTAIVFAMDAMKDNNSQLPEDDEIPEFSTAIGEVLAIPETLEALRSRVTGVYRDRWDPEKLAPSSALINYIGQAYYLQGDLDQAILFLGEASKVASTRAEANLWLDAAFAAKDGIVNNESFSQELREIMSFYGRMPADDPNTGR